MALKKAKKDEMDLTEDTQWTKDIIKDYGKYIPVITGIPKSAATSNLHVRIGSDVVDLASSLAFKKSHCFKTPSEAHRAAFYIGTMLLYEMHGDHQKSDNNLGETIYNIMKQTETMMIGNERIQKILLYAESLKKAVELCRIDWDEFHEKVNEAVKELPPHLQKATSTKISQLLGGKTLTSISDYKTVGRPRSEESENY